MGAVLQTIFFLLDASLDATFPESSFRQRITHQACVYTYLSEVKSEVDPCLDLPGLAGTQYPFQDHMGKDEGSLGVPLPTKHPLPLRSQYCSEPAPRLIKGRGIPAS